MTVSPTIDRGVRRLILRIERLLRRQALGGKPGSSLRSEGGLATPLLRLHLRDLVLDRREKLLALCESRFDRGFLGGPLGDDLRLPLARVLQAGTPCLDLLAEALDLSEDPRVLARDALDRVEPRDDVVQASSAEQHLERGVAFAVDVEVAETLGDSALSHVQALARSDEVACVGIELPVDPVELDVRVVVRLDGRAEAHVEVLELGDDRLRLRLLVLDVGVGRGRTGGKQQRRGEGHEEDDSRRPSGCRAPKCPLASTPDGPAGGGLARHKSGTLAPPPDACNPQQT